MSNSLVENMYMSIVQVSNRESQVPHEEGKPSGARTDIQVQMFRCTSRS